MLKCLSLWGTFHIQTVTSNEYLRWERHCGHEPGLARNEQAMTTSVLYDEKATHLAKKGGGII